MVILLFILSFSCSKQNSSGNRGKNKIKFIPQILTNSIDDNFDDNNENFNLNDEHIDLENINDQDNEIINNDNYTTLFKLVEEKKLDIIISELPSVEDLDILEEEDENEETFLHTLIKKTYHENSKEERDLIDIIEILKTKYGFNWNKRSAKGSYAFLAFKNNLFFPLASILQKNFNIDEEDISIYLDLIIEREDDFSNKCLRLFLAFLSSNQVNILMDLLKNSVSYYKDTSKEKFILNLIEDLSTKDTDEIEEKSIEIN